MTDSTDWLAKLEDGVKKFVQHLLEVADASLSSENVTTLDAGLLHHARSDVVAYFQPLMQILNKFRDDGQDYVTEFSLECLWRLLNGAFLIGSHGVINQSAGNYFRQPIEFETRAAQASLARRRRAERPEEKALLAAIEAVRGTGPVLRPSKEATAILDSVNQQLRVNGFDTVKVDKVRRRLEKLPRS